MPAGPNIAVLVETSTSWGKRVVEGIVEYARLHGPWFFYLEPRGRYEPVRLPAGWCGDGIIARVTSQRLAEEIVASAIPAVNISWFTFPRHFIPRCTVDETRCGQLAAEHFLERAFRNFGYCGPLRRPGYHDLVKESFVDAIQAAGYECSNHVAARDRQGGPLWQEQLAELAQWLEALSKPAAVLAWSDVRGRQITEACRYVGIHVPDDVAVLGGELDELMGAASSPPLSSIDSSGQAVGFASGKLLSQLMIGHPAPGQPIVIQPNGVITRQSTDTLAVSDGEVAQAIGYIRDHAHEGIQVSDVVRRVPLSRRVLEQRFQSQIGRAPAAEIRRVRMERAKQLLIVSEMPIPQIAIASGFNEPEAMTRTFRRELGMTPTAYRSQAKRR